MRVGNTFESCYLVSNLVAIRPLALTDQDAIVEACNDEEIQKWLPLPFPYTHENARWFIQDFVDKRQIDGSGLVNAIEYEGKFAGAIDIKRADWIAKTCEIGYWSSPWVRGKGVVTSALLMLSQWIIQGAGFQRLEVRVAPENVASQKVAEKAGFVREGIARNAGYTNSGRCDLIIFSKIPSDGV